MSSDKVPWKFEVDNERECYRVLTVENVQQHDGIRESVWIADVFSYADAEEIVSAHNASISSAT